ncbi:hypothetical protein BH09ACT8_BH09ACT8_45860 [soil metagenome]
MTAAVDDLESLRRRIVTACDSVPLITYTAEELGALVMVIEAIVQRRKELGPDIVYPFVRRTASAGGRAKFGQLADLLIGVGQKGRFVPSSGRPALGCWVK